MLLTSFSSQGAAAQVTRRTLLPATQFATDLVQIDGQQPGPTVWVSGGVHGSELAGWQAAEQISRWRVRRGRLIVVPHANRPAVQAEKRFASGDKDLNRQFPKTSGQKASGPLAQALWQELNYYQPDWVFDLHEAMSNRNLNKNSVGQTIIAHPAGQMPILAQRIIDDLNPDLPSVQKFQVIRNPVHGSLAHAAGQVLETNAAIVETSRLYPLQQRVQWHLQLMQSALERLGLAPQVDDYAEQAQALEGLPAVSHGHGLQLRVS